MKSPMSPIRKLCCFAKPKTVDDHDPAGGDVAEEAEKVTAVQPVGTPPVEAVAVPVDVPVVASPIVSPESKGHKRTSSEVAAPSSPVVAAAKPPTTPKVSRSGSSASSYQSSASVQTAIERSPLIREASVESVITAIERTPSPKSSNKEEPVSPLPTSQQSPKRGMSEDIPAPTTPSKKEEDGSQSPKKEEDEPMVASPDAKSAHQSPKRETSEEPAAPSTPSKKEDDKSAPPTPETPKLPEDVDTLDEVKKLNEIIDGEKFDVKHPFFDKISIHFGDITKIQVDAIVNAANDRLGGGGGVDGAIHRAAGHNQLQAECRKHDRPVPTGEAVVTEACKLSTHVKKIIHAVGPICYGGVTDERRKKLLSCYLRAIQLSEENGLRSIAFCCISTGIYGYDNKDAARTVIKFLWKYFSKEENVAKWDRVVLCLFMDIDKKCYQNYIRQLVLDPTFFDDDEESEDEEEEKKTKKKEEDDEQDENKKEEKKDGEKEDEKEEGKTDEKEVKSEGKEKKGEKNEDHEQGDTNEKYEPKEEESAVEEKEEKAGKSTVEGDESKKEEAETSTNNTSAPEKIEEVEEEEQDGEKGDGEKENNEVDGNETTEGGVTGKKRALSEEKEDEPPMKRDKIERESAV